MVEYRCPSCRKTLTEQGSFFPFCSERCKLKDLGAWASGAYSVPGEEASPEEIASAVRTPGSESQSKTGQMSPQKRGKTTI